MERKTIMREKQRKQESIQKSEAFTKQEVESLIVEQEVRSSAAKQTIESSAAKQTVESFTVEQEVKSFAAKQTVESLTVEQEVKSSAAKQTVESPAVEQAVESFVASQLKIIKKGMLESIPENGLEEKIHASLREKRPLIIKLGFDPSAPDIHLGHTVVLRKVRQMQELGHKAVIIIGDFTGKIGDPTGKSKTRKVLSDEQVRANAETYMEQIFKVLDRDKTEVRFNSEWLAKLNFEQVISLASTVTVARLLERDDFAGRYKRQEAIGLHEFFYPLIQAYDSVEIDADIELGGTDQTFNILMGRHLQRALGKEEQAAMFMPILEGLDGVEKMSKSLGNYIGINEPAEVMFKKVMEVPDFLILRYFELTTDLHPDKIEKFRERLTAGENPRNVKLILAENITELYHGTEQARKAKEYFLSVFSAKNLPTKMLRIKCQDKEKSLLDIATYLIDNQFVASKSEFRRLIRQGGVQINGEKISDENCLLVNGDNILKIGKKKFICFER